MAVVMSQNKGCDNIYTSEMEDIHNRVQKCYEYLKHDDIKFTDDMVTLIKLDFIDHYECKVSELSKVEDLSPITKRYLQECDNRLGSFNPMDIKQNLQEMDLLY